MFDVKNLPATDGGSLHGMDFTGRIFFDFDNFDVWRIYSTLLKASQRGVGVNVTWEEFLVDEIDPTARLSPKNRVLAACAAVRAAHPESHQRFVQALLTMIYQERDDPRKDTTLAVAARVAGIDSDEVVKRAVDPGLRLLIESSEAARRLGVVDVPTVVRNGPALYIKTTGAINYGNAVTHLDLIDRMLRDDGVWEMKKPPMGA